MIIRGLRVLRWGFAEARVSMVDGVAGDVGGMENISQLPFYVSFKQGLNLSLENRLEQANQHYQQALNLLDDRKEQLRDHYLHIYRKIIANNYALRRPAEVEQNIYALIKLKRKLKVQSMLLYDDYESLFQLFLEHNPQKAILLGRALLSPKEVEALPLRHRKLFLLNLANAYLLLGNYHDAKQRYSECLEDQPAPDLKPALYNNLALACWWAKNPLIPDAQRFDPEPHRASSVDSDFAQARELFLRGVQAAESPERLGEQEKYRLRQALSEYELDLEAKFVSGQSVLPLYNLTQYYIHNQPAQRVKILYWLRALLHLAHKHRSPLLDEAYSTLCLLTNQRAELVDFLPQALQRHTGKSSEVYFLRMSAMAAGSEGRAAEAQEALRRAQQLQSSWQSRDQFVFKRKFVWISAFRI